MNSSFSSQQIKKTSNHDANLISRQYKLNLMADFMQIKYENPKFKQSEIANRLGYPSSTLQRYRNDINMLSAYRIQPNNINKRTKKALNTNFNNDSHCEPALRRPQMTSTDLKITQTNTKSDKKNKNVLQAGSMQENIELNEHYLDELLDNINI